MKAKRYRVTIKFGENMLFADTSREKDLDEWVEAFKNNPRAEELKVYERAQVGYTLIATELNRTIGF